MLHEILIQFWPALMYGVIGAIIFSLIGMVSGTDRDRDYGAAYLDGDYHWGAASSRVYILDGRCCVQTHDSCYTDSAAGDSW